MARKSGQLGWYVTFVLIAVAAFAGIYALTGQDALAAAVRILWNGFALVFNAIARLIGSLLGLGARGVGWRRLSRISKVITGIGIGYAASVVISDDKVQRARGWRNRMRMLITIARNRWQALSLTSKIFVVVVLIASQVYLHSMLVIFPIAFLVPVVRRLWVRLADLAFGKWYWKRFGSRHRSSVNALRRLPGVRSLIGWSRVTRLRYLTAWRLWRHEPRYRIQETNKRAVNFVEPIRLWWRCELDSYVGRPLLAGPRAPLLCATNPDEPHTSERGWTTSAPSITLAATKSLAQRDA